MASFLSLAPALSLFVFFFFFWLRHIRCHSWTHVDKLLTHGSFLPLCPAPCPGHSFHWLPVVMVSGSPCRLKKKKKNRGIKGGHFGDSWTRLVPVAPCPAPSHCARGDEGRHCVRIRASCVSAHYTGECRGDGWSKKSEGAKWKRKFKRKKEWVWKRVWHREGERKAGEGGIGREVAASTAAPSITLIQAPIILFTHTHTHMNSAGELKHIKRHREQKKKKKRKSRIWRQLAQSLRQRTPPSSSSSSNPDTQRNWNKQEKTDQQCAHRIRVMQAEYLNR